MDNHYKYMDSSNHPYSWTFCPDSSLQVNSVSISDDGSRCVFGTSNEFSEGNFATFLLNGDGETIWSKPISSEKTYQGVFWTAISGNGKYVASGGETGKSQGFLKAYRSEDGKELLSVEPKSRVNQVSLSENGEYLAMCYGSCVVLYRLSEDGLSYNEVGNSDLSPCYVNSCEISREGNVVVASGIIYNDDKASNSSETQGRIIAFEVSDGELSKIGECDPGAGSMRVAVTSNGEFWAASLHDGSCVLFHRNDPASYQWKVSPDGYSMSLAYAVAITETEERHVFVACGANVHDQKDDGLLYMVRSEWIHDEHVGKIVWKNPIVRSVNPGVSLDQNATLVTATDGQPIKGSQESPGSFYLFEAQSGNPLMKQDTTLMNWPMMLSYDGKFAFGGSDNGSVYYWDTSKQKT